MPLKKFSFLAVTFLLVSTVLFPALLTDVASAQCLNCPTNVRDCHMGCSNNPCITGDYDRCDSCASVGRFRCDVYQCAWVNEYSCPAPQIR